MRFQWQKTINLDATITGSSMRTKVNFPVLVGKKGNSMTDARTEGTVSVPMGHAVGVVSTPGTIQ